MRIIVLLVTGDYRHLVHRLFQHEQDGKLTLGMAQSSRHISDLTCLTEWTEFSDYLMEGGVRYSLRVNETTAGLVLECRLNGMNRDQYVEPSLKSYIHWVGLECIVFERTD